MLPMPPRYSLLFLIRMPALMLAALLLAACGGGGGGGGSADSGSGSGTGGTDVAALTVGSEVSVVDAQ